MRIVAGTAAGESPGGGPRQGEIDYWRTRESLARRMKIVASARFAAHRRLSAKSSATNIGLQFANIYTIGIGIFLLQFGQLPSIRTVSGALGYVSLIASVFVQIMALIETLKDYSGRARAMHGCAVKINALQQSLAMDPRAEWGSLRWYHDQYQAIIADYDVNHDPIDYLAAQLEPDSRRARSRAEAQAVAMWRLRYWWDVYGLTSLILASPVVLLAVLIRAGIG